MTWAQAISYAVMITLGLLWTAVFPASMLGIVIALLAPQDQGETVAMMTMLVVTVLTLMLVFGSTVWVVLDQPKRGIGTRELGMPPMALFGLCATCWIFGFPYYLAVRFKTRRPQ